jgi:bifunctional non-homologous end joining protein LigD
MSAASETWQIGDHTVEIGHLEKLYWPEAGVTKGDMLRYYRSIAPVMLPHFRERPATLRVFPNGAAGESYYQRARPEYAPCWLRSVPYRPKTSKASNGDRSATPLPLVDNAAGLIWFANAGTIEFHLWGARLPKLSEPDQAIFDLDSGATAPFTHVLEAGVCLREQLDQLGLKGYPKTSGGHGLHVYVPLAAGHTFVGVRTWVKAVAEHLAAGFPSLIAVAHGATHSGTHITIDYAQNSIGRNNAAPYTLRGRGLQPLISTPLTWEEVAAGNIQPADFTPAVVLERVQRLGDLFAPALQEEQHLPDHGST